MNAVFETLFNQIWHEIFPNQQAIDIDKFKALYTSDIQLPIAKKSEVTGETVYISPEYGYKRFLSNNAILDRTSKDDFIEQNSGVASLDDVLQKSQNLFLFKGSRQINSDATEESDDIYSSSYIYNSTHIYSSNKILFSYNCAESEYLMASKTSKASSFSIRAVDSASVTNCFDVSFLGKSANCYFCHSSYNLRDCMFCFHLMSKQYCIANVQYTKDEYFKLRDKILADYFTQLNSDNSFIKLSDLN